VVLAGYTFASKTSWSGLTWRASAQCHPGDLVEQATLGYRRKFSAMTR
jgi:hypothetical protein